MYKDPPLSTYTNVEDLLGGERGALQNIIMDSTNLDSPPAVKVVMCTLLLSFCPTVGKRVAKSMV